MILTRDIIINSDYWAIITDKLIEEDIFETYFDVFKFCACIGLNDNKKVDFEKPKFEKGNVRQIARNTAQNDREILPKLRELIILFDSNDEYDKLSFDDRKRLAYDKDNENLTWLDELVKYANYGIQKLSNNIKENFLDFEIMELMKDEVLK